MSNNNSIATKQNSSNAIAKMDRTEFARWFIESVQSDLDRWEDTAKHLRARIEAGDHELPDFIEETSKGFVTAAFVDRYSRIGTKYIAQLAIAECPGARELKKLPLEIQRSCFSQAVPVLICKDGEWQTLRVDLHHLTTEQAQQVFGKDHVRNTAEQRAWIEDKRVKKLDPVPAKGNLPYRIVGKRVICMETCEFDVNDLVRLTQELLAR